MLNSHLRSHRGLGVPCSGCRHFACLNPCLPLLLLLLICPLLFLRSLPYLVPNPGRADPCSVPPFTASTTWRRFETWLPQTQVLKAQAAFLSS